MDTMLRAALREITGPLNQLLMNLAGEEGGSWLDEFKRFLRKEPCWTQVGKLLKHISAFTVELDSGPFIARERFVVDTSDEATVKISYLGDNFREWMLGLKEQPPDEDYLCCHELLLKASVDGPIIEELGGEQKAETTLSEVFALMKKQRDGEKGILLTNGYANIFYVRDINGVLRAVRVGWDGDGWLVNANSVGDPDWWNAGCQVFSRNSL